MKRKKKKFEHNYFDLYDNIIRNNTEDNVNEKNKIDSLIGTNYEFLKEMLSITNKDIYKFLLKNNKIENKYKKYFFVKHFCNFYKVINLLKKKINDYFTFNDNLKTDLFIGLIKDDNCRPFWNEKIKNKSKDIFLPTDENMKKNKNPRTFKQETWFETQHFKIKNQKVKFKKIEINKIRIFNNTYIDKKTKIEKFNVKARKIKLFFTVKQKKYFKRLFGIYRYFYNRAIQYINNYDKETNKTFYLIDYKDEKSKKEINLDKVKSKFDFKTMRTFLKENYPDWTNDVTIQSHFVDQAFKEASNNYNKCMEKYKKNNKPFELKHKTKRNKKQTVNIEKTMFNKKTRTLFGGIRENKKVIFKNIKIKENINKYDICDSSITCNTRLNEYYLNMNYHDKTKKDKKLLKNKRVISNDPGIKSFLCGYSDNEVNFIGIGINTKMKKICKEIDIINSMMYKKKKNNKKEYKYKSNKRRNLKRALHRKIKNLENLKTELHDKSIYYLVSNYGKIIMPKLETQEMACKFNSKLARSLYNLSSFKFMSKLEKKCKEYDIDLVTRPEYYTSKTCTKCGNIKHDLKLSDRVYKCKKCKLVIDRDVNAARNIMLRNNEM